MPNNLSSSPNQISKHYNDGLPDIQNTSKDFVPIPIYKVGIRGYKVPLRLVYGSNKEVQFSTIATVSAYASLPEDKKGVNMSRFSLIITENVKDEVGTSAVKKVLYALKESVGAEEVWIKFKFDYLMKVQAPVSKEESWMDVPVILEGYINKDDKIKTYVTVEVFYTSLCPCSKEMSLLDAMGRNSLGIDVGLGAHNQRSMARIKVELNDGAFIYFEEFKKIVDMASSSPIYNSLKRADEKYVTEAAYKNPKFCEDTAREIANQLSSWIGKNILDYVVVAENFESIHTSNAVAVVKCPDSHLN